MRHRGHGKQEEIGPIRRIAGVIAFIALLPLMLPLVLVARLFGLRPGRHFAGHGCRGRPGCGRGNEPSETAGDVGTPTQA